ncbi:ABC transporter ATP-binding protein [Mesorhizobium sp. M7A.F.Ca.US.006.01.1.1]|uniref:ABC transporter ATP-binding protein n=1 Tax=Mesorhizobium sp. M7A.F.Ca.US.006.01.1.1 TaxID=2496707 RepID=UPI000FCAC15E|nr:ABC transporter ATP-binding protein [Mesorhizobium sp. M7A.F.Ca.US.006.01.1.1]RUZ77969.1 ABC transporter ATP-binding protein [Mesorhizobium sp. M7A.F.Ca.US.006.01.1.1]
MGESIPLAVEGLHAWYGESHVLHGLSLTVGGGETIALLGRNGVGKTTLMRAIVGIVPSRKGKIRIWGADAIATSPHKVARLGVGYVPEERGIYSSLTVHENLILPPVLSSKGMHIDELFELFPNLKERRSSLGGQLSGGEQQMLAIARILHAGASLMLLDEPTEGLAPVVVHKIGEVIQLLKAKGISILIAEQNLYFASKVADRFYVIEDGKVTATYTHDEFSRSREAVEVNLGV